ncbi:MAG: tetratricopeptide repeat protein [Ktedonobacteraceae bacterium]
MLLKALAKDPAARFPSIQAFAHALIQADLAGVLLIGPSPPPVIPPPHSARLLPQPIQLRLKTKQDWLNEGNALYNLKRYEEALDAYNRAIALDPNFANAYNNKGAALNGLKRYEEALDAYNRAIALDPNFANAYHNKGIALRNLKRPEEARAAFEKARQLGYEG